MSRRLAAAEKVYRAIQGGSDTKDILMAAITARIWSLDHSDAALGETLASLRAEIDAVTSRITSTIARGVPPPGEIPWIRDLIEIERVRSIAADVAAEVAPPTPTTPRDLADTLAAALAAIGGSSCV